MSAGRSRWLGWLALPLALGLCACSTGPAPRPTATFGFSRSPTPGLTYTTATSPPAATPTQPADLPTSTAGATTTPQLDQSPAETPTRTRTPRQSPTPTINLTPTPDPRILSVAAVPCEPASDFALCTDPLLGLTFEQPAAWGPITATLRESFAGTGLAYDYQFGGSLSVLAGGRSADFTEGRGGMLTDFAGAGQMGFNGASPAEWCAGLSAALCEVVQPQVVLDIRFPEAEYLCLDSGQYFFEAPLAFIWILLPDNTQINGFVFVAPILSDEAGEDLLALRRDILGWDSGALHTRCEPEQQAAFDAEIARLIAALEAGQGDGETLENLADLRHLAESLRSTL